MKNILFAFAMVLAGTAVRADVMYWTLDFSDDGVNPLVEEMGARLVAVKGEAAPIYFYGGVLKPGTDATLGNVEGGQVIASGIADNAAYDFATANWTFYIELGTFSSDGSGSAAWKSNGYSSSELADSIWVNLMSTATVWNAAAGKAFSPAPEPTSGILLLVGFSGLLLRRRRIGSVFQER